MFTVRDMLEMPVFHDFQIIAGKAGENREVTTVSVMDAPDIYEWMKGGEFLITSAYVMREHPEEAEDLIARLVEHGASAFGIKFTRFIDHLPQKALEKADELGFPIISIPVEFAWTDVINPLLREIVNAQAQVLQYTEDLHRVFTESVLEDRSVPDILEMLESFIPGPAVLADIRFRRLYSTKKGEKLREALKDLPLGEELEEALEGYPVYWLQTSGERYGCLIFGQAKEESPLTEYRKIAVEQAAVVLILKIQRQLSNAQIEAKYREEFVQDLIYGNIKSREEIQNRAKLYQWDFSEGGVTVIVDVDDFKQRYAEGLDRQKNEKMEREMSRVLRISRNILGAEENQASYGKLNDRIVFLLSGSRWRAQDARCRGLLETVRREIQKSLELTVTIGVGRYREDILEISESFQEAQTAVAISRTIHPRDQVSCYEELGVYKLLGLVKESREAEEFLSFYVEKLKDYDRENHGELLATAEALIDCDWNLKRASERLFIHYNSMKYRYRKICEVLGEDFRDGDSRLNFQIAVSLYRMNSSPASRIDKK